MNLVFNDTMTEQQKWQAIDKAMLADIEREKKATKDLIAFIEANPGGLYCVKGGQIELAKFVDNVIEIVTGTNQRNDEPTESTT